MFEDSPNFNIPTEFRPVYTGIKNLVNIFFSSINVKLKSYFGKFNKKTDKLKSILWGKLIYFLKLEMKTVHNVVTGEVCKLHGVLGGMNEAVSTTNELKSRTFNFIFKYQ